MDTKTIKYKSIDEYHAAFTPEIRKLLDKMRSTIRSAAPDAGETISYNMPAFKQDKVLVYYAGYAKHIGFYPTSSPIVAFKEQIAKYKTSKGAIQFPLDEPLPEKLIKEIVKFRLKEVSQ